MINIQSIVDKHYDQMFQELLDIVGDNFYDLRVEIIDLNGLSVKRSWREREERLIAEEKSRQNDAIITQDK